MISTLFVLSQVADGESRVTLLQREVERLNHALVKAQESESFLKERNQCLNQNLQEVSGAHSSTQGRQATLQKSLNVAEQDRRQLQVGEKESGVGRCISLKKPLLIW